MNPEDYVGKAIVFKRAAYASNIHRGFHPGSTGLLLDASQQHYDISWWTLALLTSDGAVAILSYDTTLSPLFEVKG